MIRRRLPPTLSPTLGVAPYPVPPFEGGSDQLATVPTDNGTNAFALALREAAPSVQAHHELRENVVVPGDRAPTVPRGARAQRVAEHVAPDRTKAARGSGGPRVG